MAVMLYHSRTIALAWKKSKEFVPVDDSFMIQGQSAVDDQLDSQWRTDMSMVLDLTVASQPENGTQGLSQDKVVASGSYEPDDLCVVLVRDSRFESSRASWAPEMDYGTEISSTEAYKKSSAVEINDLIGEKYQMNSKSISTKKNVTPGTNSQGKEARSKVLQGSLKKSKFGTLSKGKLQPSPVRRPMVQKSKLEKEEEIRNKMEELLIQRQKRIAEKTAASGFTPAMLNKATVGSKTASTKYDKHRPQLTSQENKKLSSPKWGTTNSSNLVIGHIKQKGGSALSK